MQRIDIRAMLRCKRILKGCCKTLTRTLSADRVLVRVLQQSTPSARSPHPSAQCTRHGDESGGYDQTAPAWVMWSPLAPPARAVRVLEAGWVAVPPGYPELSG